MKYLKLFENNKLPKLQIDDYVIIKVSEYKKSYLNIDKINFFESHIAKIDRLKQEYAGVEFDESCEGDYYFFFEYDEIEFYSKNFEDVNIILNSRLTSKKFNI